MTTIETKTDVDPLLITAAIRLVEMELKTPWDWAELAIATAGYAGEDGVNDGVVEKLEKLVEATRTRVADPDQVPAARTLQTRRLIASRVIPELRSGLSMTAAEPLQGASPVEVQAVIDRLGDGPKTRDKVAHALEQVRYVPKFNQVNDNIGWAKWSWNPVTGCLHNCPYCYARDIANRFYPQGFEPTFLPERLAAPAHTTVPGTADPDDPSWRRVFTCSMADLFGKWVPQEWIDAVFSAIVDAPQWEFLCLTKFPQRLAELEWPANAWVGTTVDRQHRVELAQRHFAGVKAGVRWLSCEPLLEPLKFDSLEMFDWVVIGACTKSSGAPEFAPPFDWVADLYEQARASGCRVYLKSNLFGVGEHGAPGMAAVREWPR